MTPDPHKSLREHLLYLLRGGGAHLDFEAAVARARRALAEFRIRGVSTNIPFLQAVLEDPEFVAGNVSTAFIEQRPELLTTHAPGAGTTRRMVDEVLSAPNDRPLQNATV